MTNENNGVAFTPRIPDYSGDGVAIWKALDKNGKTFLKVAVLGGKSINCFSTERTEPTV